MTTTLGAQPVEAPRGVLPAAPGGVVPILADRDDASSDPRPTREQVVAQYGDHIYNLAYRLTGNVEDAADLTQDVFVRVFRNLERYEPGTFEGWLYRVTKNLFLDGVRRRAKVRFEALPEEDWRVPASREPGPADVIERRTLEAGLERALLALAPSFRLAVVLCDVEGLSYEEIADATGWPIGTVRSRIHRGRKQLHAALTTSSDADEADVDAPDRTRGGGRDA